MLYYGRLIWPWTFLMEVLMDFYSISLLFTLEVLVVFSPNYALLDPRQKRCESYWCQTSRSRSKVAFYVLFSNRNRFVYNRPKMNWIHILKSPDIDLNVPTIWWKLHVFCMLNSQIENDRFSRIYMWLFCGPYFDPVHFKWVEYRCYNSVSCKKVLVEWW